MRRPITSLICITTLVCTAWAQDAAKPADKAPNLDQMLGAIPSDAALVVVFPNLDAFVKGVQDFGMAISVDELIDYDAEELWDATGISDLPDVWRNCIRTDGPIALVQLDTEGSELFVATVKEKPAVPPEEDEHVRIRGDIIIAAPDPLTLSGLEAANGKFAKQFGERAAELLKKNQVVVWLNVPEWSMEIGSMLGIVQMGAQAAAATSPGNPQMAIAFVNWFCEKLRNSADECEALIFAGKVGKAGIHITQATHFRPDGSICEYLRGVRKPSKNILRGMPSVDGQMYIAVDWQTSPETQSLTEELMKVMLSAIQPDPDMDAAEYERLKQEAIKSYGLITGYNGVVAFSANEPLQAVGMYFTEQPKKLQQSFASVWKLTPTMMKAMSPGITVAVASGQEQIGTVPADVVRIAATCEQEPMHTMIEKMYGKEICTLFLPNADGVGYAMGPEAKARELAGKALATGATAPVADLPRVKAALATLSPQPNGLMLMDVPAIALWGMEFSGGVAPPPELFLDPNKPLPYIAGALYLHEADFTLEVDVPAAIIRKFADIAEGPGAPPSSQEAY